MAENVDWCLIESEPAIFNDLLFNLSASGVQFEEVSSLTIEHVAQYDPVYGFIFLYMLDNPASSSTASSLLSDDEAREKQVFFVRQHLTNSCATVAIVNLLLNINDENVKVSGPVDQYRAFTESMDFDTRGHALSNSESIARAHNKYREPSMTDIVDFRDYKSQCKQKPYHYVVFMPVRGELYEFDGLKEGPVKLGPVNDQDWIKDVIEAMKTRIEQVMENKSTSDGHFNIMVACGDLQKKYENRLAEILDASNGTPSESALIEISQLEQMLENEKEKRERYKIEVMWCTHAWLRFVSQLLTSMAQKKILSNAFKSAVAENLADFSEDGAQ